MATEAARLEFKGSIGRKKKNGLDSHRPWKDLAITTGPLQTNRVVPRRRSATGNSLRFEALLVYRESVFHAALVDVEPTRVEGADIVMKSSACRWPETAFEEVAAERS
jgi:hypothetical protein